MRQQVRHAAGAAIFDVVMHRVGIAARGLERGEYRRGHGAARESRSARRARNPRTSVVPAPCDAGRDRTRSWRVSCRVWTLPAYRYRSAAAAAIGSIRHSGLVAAHPTLLCMESSSRSWIWPLARRYATCRASPSLKHRTMSLFAKSRPHRRAFRAACRHRADAAVDLHVLVRRRARQIHRRDLFGRAIAVAARLRGAARAVADDLAAARRVSRGWNGRGCNCSA